MARVTDCGNDAMADEWHYMEPVVSRVASWFIAPLTVGREVVWGSMLALTLALLLAPSSAGTDVGAQPTARQVQSFSSAKKALEKIYADHRSTLYTGCAYDAKMRVVYDDCRYLPRQATIRALRVEWEHVVPAEAFGQAFVEWREGHPACVDRRGRPFRGRHCAAKANVTYRRMEADMHNLFPEIGELNARRSNLPMAELPDAFLLAGAGVKLGAGTFEPRPGSRGDVARAYLYMDTAYPGLGIVSAKNRKLFAAWSRLDPVDDWECERARRITAVQRRRNPVVEAACEVRQAGRARPPRAPEGEPIERSRENDCTKPQ